MNQSVNAKLGLPVDVECHLVETWQCSREGPKMVKGVRIGRVESQVDDANRPPQPKEWLRREMLGGEWLQCRGVRFVGLAAPYNDSDNDPWAIWHSRDMLINRASKFVVPPAA